MFIINSSICINMTTAGVVMDDEFGKNLIIAYIKSIKKYIKKLQYRY